VGSGDVKQDFGDMPRTASPFHSLGNLANPSHELQVYPRDTHQRHRGHHERRPSAFSDVLAVINPLFTQEADRSLERSLFVTGWALVISALIAVCADRSDGKKGLTDYHALVVLNLSFINYWAGVDLLRRRTGGQHKTYEYMLLVRLFTKLIST
jgi:hypothetical protein